MAWTGNKTCLDGLKLITEETKVREQILNGNATTSKTNLGNKSISDEEYDEVEKAIFDLRVTDKATIDPNEDLSPWHGTVISIGSTKLQVRSSSVAQVITRSAKLVSDMMMKTNVKMRTDPASFSLAERYEYFPTQDLWSTDGFTESQIDILLEEVAKYSKGRKELQVWASNMDSQKLLSEKLINPIGFIDTAKVWKQTESLQKVDKETMIICCSCGAFNVGEGICHSCKHEFLNSTPRGLIIFQSAGHHRWIVPVYGLKISGINSDGNQIFSHGDHQNERIRSSINIWRENSDKMIRKDWNGSYNDIFYPKTDSGLPNPGVVLFVSMPMRMIGVKQFLLKQMDFGRSVLLIQGLGVSELKNQQLKKLGSTTFNMKELEKAPIPMTYTPTDGCIVRCGNCYELSCNTETCLNCWSILKEGHTQSFYCWVDISGNILCCYVIRPVLCYSLDFESAYSSSSEDEAENPYLDDAPDTD